MSAVSNTPQAFQESEPQLLQHQCGVGKPGGKYSGKIHASTLLQRLFTHPPRPFPLGRGAGQKQFLIPPTTHNRIAVLAFKTFSLVPRSAAS
jgi:hypothetical protein